MSVSFHYESQASAHEPETSAKREPETGTENTHSSIKSLFSPLVHNILFYLINRYYIAIIDYRLDSFLQFP